MLRFDIKARLRSVGNTYGHPQWTVDVRGVEDQRRFLEEVGVHGERTVAVTRALERLGSMTAAGRFDTIPPGVWERVRRVMEMCIRDRCRKSATCRLGSAKTAAGTNFW